MKFIATMATAVALVAGSLVAAAPAAPAAAADTTYYIDSVTGSDANAGTSTSAPWKSLAMASALTATAGTRILLKAGSTWNGQYLDLKGSGTAAEPATVGRYGGTTRPVIDFDDTAVGGEGFGVRITNGSYWHVEDLEITSGQFATSKRRNGILVLGTGAGGGAFRHIHIVNNYVHDVFGNDRRTGGINVHARQVTSTSPESTWDDVLIQGNTVTNVADTGIQTMTDALLANSNWTHEYDAFQHVVMRRNTVSQIHRDGILVRAATAPLVEYNTTDRIGKYTTADPAVVGYLPQVAVVAAQWAYYADRAVFQYNQASRTRRIDGDGQPWDFDIGVTNSVYQYNYSFANEGGVLLTMNGTSGNIFRYNISQNDLDRSVGAFHIVSGAGSLAVYNNVFFRDQGQTNPLTNPNPTSTAAYTNNIFLNRASGSYSTGGGISYTANTYVGANASVAPDAQRLTADPLFTAPGGATGIADAAAAYTQGSGSASRDSGVTVANNGGLDFAGRQLYSGAPDRGAVEGAAVSVLSGETFESASLGGWTGISGSWAAGGTPGALRQSATAGEAIASTGNPAWTDYTVSARVTPLTAGGNAGVLVRYTDTSNFAMLRVDVAASTLDLYTKVAGVLTLVASQPFASRPGEFVSLRADVRGSTITGWADGSPLITWTNPGTSLASGKVGVRTAASSGAFDEVVVRG
ncbi:family 16 glycoside hydrolase [Herbiconiux sp. VKM Ac-2851]|uniref:family 16 glycoside hydrolase n=1 Tax=Herbiconiux sp. VKM Ac-2851 TaxID=2739025 RepID=UPI00352F0510